MLAKRLENWRIFDQNRAPKRRQHDTKKQYFRDGFCLRIWCVFWACFSTEMEPKWVQKGVQNWPQNDEKSMPAPGCRFRLILGRFWVNLGSILGRFWDDLGFILGWFLKGFWRPFVAASVANYMTSLRMRTSQLQQKNSQLSKNMRFPSPQPCWPGYGKRAVSVLELNS